MEIKTEVYIFKDAFIYTSEHIDRSMVIYELLSHFEPRYQFVISIVTRTSCMLLGIWWRLFCTLPTRQFGFLHC